MQKLKIFNGNIITPNGILNNGCLLVEDGRILEVADRYIEAEGFIGTDAEGQYVSPGFIDLHIHGGGGADFMDATPEAFITIASTHAQYGTTAMTPTTLTAEADGLFKALDAYASVKGSDYNGADLIGMHLEGPYFALNQRGAQDPRYIRNPNPEEYKHIISYFPHIVRWSAAPELPGALDFGRYLLSKGILPAIAHTDALYDDVVNAVDAGYSLATHLYSSMTGVVRKNLRRHAGVVESVFLIDELDAEIIADGVHLPAALLKLVKKIKGTEHTALITDAMRAAGMPPGDTVLGPINGGLSVYSDGEVAMLHDRSSFAGSVATADRLVRNMINLADVSLTDAVKMITETPARIMNIADKKGSLQKGKDADIIFFNNDIQVTTTIVKGKKVFEQANAVV